MKYALISIHDKTGIIDFARELVKLEFEIIATEGTFNTLKRARVPSIKHVSDVTGFTEMLDGRIKTEHPKLIAAILALRNNKEHMEKLERLGIKPIDLLVCNFHPVYHSGIKQIDLASYLNGIDIGGPNMVRAAAKNFTNITIIVNSSRYNEVLLEYKEAGEVSINTKKKLAIEALKETALYDSEIYKFLESTRQNSF